MHCARLEVLSRSNAIRAAVEGRLGLPSFFGRESLGRLCPFELGCN